MVASSSSSTAQPKMQTPPSQRRSRRRLSTRSLRPVLTTTAMAWTSSAALTPTHIQKNSQAGQPLSR
jgi:hypothetical protein